MKNISLHKVFLVIVLLLLGGLIVSGLLLIDSPITARQKTWDQEKRNELRQLSDQITYYYDAEGQLPKDLLALNTDRSLITDNQSLELYEYNVLESNQFKLCAVFNLAYEKNEDSIAYRYPGVSYDGVMDHTEGRSCFEFVVERHNGSDHYEVRLLD